jgi:hypothetical protein
MASGWLPLLALFFVLRLQSPSRSQACIHTVSSKRKEKRGCVCVCLDESSRKDATTIMSENKDAEGEQHPTTDVVSDKPDRTIVTEQGGGENGKDDCSDLTDNNPETDESTPKSFPQKVSTFHV